MPAELGMLQTNLVGLKPVVRRRGPPASGYRRTTCGIEAEGSKLIDLVIFRI